MEYRICSVETCKKTYGVAEGVTKARQLSIWGRQMLQESLVLQGLPPQTPIERGESGKPFLPFYPMFHFNISHTVTHVALGLHSAPIGIDIERPRVYKADLVRRFFHPKEAEFLENLQEEQRDEAFTRIWTLKEAFVKRSGEGIAGTFNRFAVLPKIDSSINWDETALEFSNPPKENSKTASWKNIPPFCFPRLQSLYIEEEDLFLAICL